MAVRQPQLGQCYAGEMVRTTRGPLAVLLRDSSESSSRQSGGGQATFGFQKVHFAIAQPAVSGIASGVLHDLPQILLCISVYCSAFMTNLPPNIP